MLVQGVTDYAIYMLDPEGLITKWNAGAQRIKGYTEAEVLGTHFSRFYTPDDQASGLPARALSTASTEGRFEQEGWRVRKDGSRFIASALLQPIADSDGKLIGSGAVPGRASWRGEAARVVTLARGHPPSCAQGAASPPCPR